MTEKDEVCGVYLAPMGGPLTILIDYGPGILTDEGRIRWAGEGWITERAKPRRLGRNRMEVCPWHPSNI